VAIDGYFRLNYHSLLMAIGGYSIGRYSVGGHKHTEPPKNCNHKYNLSVINFFGNVWTSHLKLFLRVLSIFD
jgi:hypothetical protein